MFREFLLKKKNTKYGVLKYRLISRHKASGLSIEIPIESPIFATFVNEHSGHYYGKLTRLITEIQVGDNSFDEKVYIYSEQSCLKDLLIENSTLRDSISQALSDHGEMIVEPKRLILKFFPEGEIQHQMIRSNETLSSILEEKHAILLKINEEWKIDPLAVKPELEEGIYFRGNFLDWFSWVYLLLGILVMIATSDHRELMLPSDIWLYSVALSGVMSGFFLWGSKKFIGTSSRTFAYLIKNWLLQVLSTFMICYNIIPYLNVEFDNSQGKEIEAVLIKKSLPRGKGSPNFIYEMHSEKVFNYKMYVQFEEFEKHNLNEIRKFRLHQGRFGYRWGYFLGESKKQDK